MVGKLSRGDFLTCEEYMAFRYNEVHDESYSGVSGCIGECAYGCATYRFKGGPLPPMPEDVPFQPISIYGMIEGLVNGPYIRVAQLYAELGDKDSMEALMCEAWEFLRNDEEMIRGSSCASHRQCRASSSNPRRTCYSAFSFLVWLN